jgi:hypothetical protein
VSIIPIAAGFAMLVSIWNDHFLFFRRYALADGVIITLNTALLLLILYIAYPLRFVFDSLSGIRRCSCIADVLAADSVMLFLQGSKAPPGSKSFVKALDDMCEQERADRIRDLDDALAPLEQQIDVNTADLDEERNQRVTNERTILDNLAADAKKIEDAIL